MAMNSKAKFGTKILQLMAQRFISGCLELEEKPQNRSLLGANLGNIFLPYQSARIQSTGGENTNMGDVLAGFSEYAG